MKFDAQRFLIDFNIPYETTGKNSSSDFFQMNCPFCDDSGQHFGFSKTMGYGNCWKCGNHSLFNILQMMTDLDYHELRSVIVNYSGSVILNKKEPSKYSKASKCELPQTGYIVYNKKAVKYLTNRNFHVPKVTCDWNLCATGPIGEYKFRIVAPIYYQNRLVSYQDRDITGKAELRYKACKIENEVLHHKHTLYGIDNVKNRKAVIVEGITDCWRLGHGSIATFGTGYTSEQINMMVKHLDKAFICYDDFAEEQGEKLAETLNGLGVSVEILSIDASDPGEMTDIEAIELMKILKED